MGESSRNYQNGKIYCIRNAIDDDIYVGSSCQPLSKRMAYHNTSRKSEKKKHFKMYKKMNEYGFENFYIELYEEYPCENVEQLRRREGEVIRDLKPVLNKEIAGRTIKEWYADNEGYNRNYYLKNIDKIKEDDKKRYQNNKEKKKEQSKQRYENKREEILEKQAVKCNCECGGHYTQNHRARHLRTKKHQEYLIKQK